jgi:hypothetical protein
VFLILNAIKHLFLPTSSFSKLQFIGKTCASTTSLGWPLCHSTHLNTDNIANKGAGIVLKNTSTFQTKCSLKNRQKTNSEIPQPTSPHEFNQVTILDVVTQVADIDPVFSLADLGEFDSLFMVGVHGTTE